MEGILTLITTILQIAIIFFVFNKLNNIDTALKLLNQNIQILTQNQKEFFASQMEEKNINEKED